MNDEDLDMSRMLVGAKYDPNVPVVVSSSVLADSKFITYKARVARSPAHFFSKYLSGKIPPITPLVEDIISTSELVDEHPLSCLLSYYGANENEEDHSPFYLLFDILVGEGEVSQKEALALLNEILRLTNKWSCGVTMT